MNISEIYIRFADGDIVQELRWDSQVSDTNNWGLMIQSCTIGNLKAPTGLG